MIPDLTHPQKAKHMFADRKTLGGEKMRRSAILATAAALALAGCSKKDPDSLAAAWEKAALSCKKTEGALKRYFAEQACSTRDEIERTLASAGYCYGDHGGTGQWDWKICTEEDGKSQIKAENEAATKSLADASADAAPAAAAVSSKKRQFACDQHINNWVNPINQYTGNKSTGGNFWGPRAIINAQDSRFAPRFGDNYILLYTIRFSNGNTYDYWCVNDKNTGAVLGMESFSD